MRMALRDARRGLKPLFLSMACVILSVASIVIAFSFRANVQSSVQTQSKSLLGADLAIGGREPFSPEAESLIRSIGGDQSRQIISSYRRIHVFRQPRLQLIPLKYVDKSSHTAYNPIRNACLRQSRVQLPHLGKELFHMDIVGASRQHSPLILQLRRPPNRPLVRIDLVT